MPPTRRRATRPDTDALAALQGEQAGEPRLQKAPVSDPVIDAGRRTEEAAAPAAAKQAGRASGAGAKEKLGFYCRPEDANRARAAYDWTRPMEQHRSLSDFIASALMHEVQRLERKYHDGQPWPPVSPGQLPTGKPVGS